MQRHVTVEVDTHEAAQGSAVVLGIDGSGTQVLVTMSPEEARRTASLLLAGAKELEKV